MSLLDLPPELLTLIAEYVGVSELRRSVAYLLVAKRWYHAVLPVYLSQLPLSSLYLASHNDLERLPPSDTALSKLVQAKVNRLSVRLVGHPSKRPSLNPWHDDPTPWDFMDLDELDDDVLDGTKKLTNWDCDWMTAGPVETSGGGRWRWDQEQRVLHQWGISINRKVIDMATILPGCRNLEEFSLEASSEECGREGPRWDYLQDFTMFRLISSLPLSLKNLTLDMCGSRTITPEPGRNSIHLCPLIAERLRDFQNVRLRLRCICPDVLNTSPLTPTAESRLKTLVIKLSLPFFPDAYDESNRYETGYDVEPCSVTRVPLYKTMFAAGADYASRFPGVSMLRISHRWQSDTHSPEQNASNIELAVADCVRKRYLFDASEAFCYEDAGWEWYAWESSDSLQESGSSEEYFRMKYRSDLRSRARRRYDDLFGPGPAQSTS
ncbi:hypothetical protein BDR22DRAFT_893927 [Usnea florida]